MNKIGRSLLFIICVYLLGAYLPGGEKFKHPDTPKIKVADNIHGTEIIDNYRWLEQIKDPKVQDWLSKQNDLSKKILQNLPARKWMIDRFTYFSQDHTKKITAKSKIGDRVIWLDKKKKGNKENWFILTQKDEKAPEEELVNLNDYGDHIVAEMTMIHPSPSGKYLVFSIEQGGKENDFCRLLDLETGKLLPDTLVGWRHTGVLWLPDSSGFYYTAYPKKGEVPPGDEYGWSAVYLHKMGTQAEKDKKIFFHPTGKHHVHLARFTPSKKYILFLRDYFGFNNNEIYFKKTGDSGPPRPLATGFDAMYQVREKDDKFYIQTNWKAPMSRIFVTDADKPEREHWKELIPETGDKIDFRGFALSEDYIFVNYLHHAASKIKMYDKSGRYLQDIPLPYIGSGGAYIKDGEKDVSVSFYSYTFPFSRFKYNIETGKLTFAKQTFPLKVDPSPYITRQVWYTSKDGTKIPMFLAQRKDAAQNSRNYVMLHGYGGFNKSMKPMFLSELFIWLEAGGMLAIPNLRGGGEYGKKWHLAGSGVNKQNTFDDCIAAAEWLIQNKYTNPRRLVLYGSSNGGLLAGAVGIQRPDLFKAVWSNVPLLDMVRYHKFARAKFWLDEYGNPDDPAQFKHILNYSPYHKIKEGVPYPAMLFTAGENDPRCNPFHAMKTAARLQAANSGDNPILLRVFKHSGHGTGVLQKEEVLKKAEGWAFLMYHLGMKTPDQ